MKILIIGATGDTGQRLLRQGLEDGHEITAYVRNEAKLQAQLKGDTPPSLTVITGDVMDQENVTRACRGQDVVINAAGNVGDGDRFVELVESVAHSVEQGLGAGGRFWFFGGAAALDVPGTATMTLTLPKVPTLFRAHEQKPSPGEFHLAELVNAMPGTDDRSRERATTRRIADFHRHLANSAPRCDKITARGSDRPGLQTENA